MKKKQVDLGIALTAPFMKSHFSTQSKPINGWRLNFILIGFTLVLTDVVVALVEKLVVGHLGADTMMISTLSGLIIASLVVSLSSVVRNRLAKIHERELELAIVRAKEQTSMAVEAAKMLFWELDLRTSQFHFDGSKLPWLGLESTTQPPSLENWFGLIHPDDLKPFMQRFRSALEPGAEDFDFDYRLGDTSGSWSWVHSLGRVNKRDADGNPLSAVGGTVNINQRKMTELSLLENKERLAIIFNEHPDSMLITRLSDGLITEVNEAFVRSFGYNREQAIGQTTLELGLWLHQEEQNRISYTVKAQGRCDNLEIVFCTLTGQHINAAIDVVAAHMHGVHHLVWTIRDISKRIKTESDLKKSEILLRSTLAATDEGILMIGQGGKILSANQRFLELWNVPKALAETDRDDLMLDHVLGQLCDPKVFMDQVKRLYESEEEARDVLHFKDGRVFARFTRALQIDGQRGRIWCFKDFTEQSRAQSALASSEEKLRSILDNVDACIYVKDTEGRYTFANRATCELWNTSLDNVIGRRDDDFFDFSSTQNIQKNDRAVFATGLSTRIEESNRLPASGKLITYLSTKIPLRHENGSIYAICGISTDVTSIKQLNSDLAQSNRFLSVLMEAIPIPIFYKDTMGRYLGVNQAYENFMGRTRNSMIGKILSDFSQVENAEIHHASDLQMMEQRGTQVFETQVTYGPDSTRDVIFHKACFLSSNGDVGGVIGAILDITRRKQAELVLQASERRASSLYTLLRRVADNVPDLIWAKDIDKRFLFANQAVCAQLLVANDTDEPVGKDDLFFALRERERHPDDPHWHTFGELCQNSDDITLQRGCASQFEEFGNVKGKLLYLDVRKAPLLGENGHVIGVVGTARDITESREAQEKLKVSAMVLANSSEALLLTDAENRVVDINPAFTRLAGYTLDEIKGQNPRFLKSGKQGTDFYSSMWADIEAKGHWQGEIWNRKKDGQMFAGWLTINTLYLDDGSVHRRVGLYSDITAKKLSEELLWTQANFDSLTGLPNRRMFLDRLTQDIKKSHRGGSKFALLFLDLDNFKQVNDTLGHDMGDFLLAEAARRISSCIRGSDTVARIGGDEFTVILGDLADVGGIDRIANGILTTLTQPFELGTEHAYISASIGITIFPDDATNQEDLLKNADQAMYVSKDTGRNRFSYFTNGMQISAQYRLRLINDLRVALVEEQFELHFQPIVEMKTGRINKAEALLRWTHPIRGSVSPVEFIALAEESGLIHDIGNWVFERAVKQVQIWRAEIEPTFQISVNLSPLQIQSGAERFNWQYLLSQVSLSGEAVIIEITEGLLLDKSPKVTAELLAFGDAGIQVAIDDFGTGYSAMAYLKQLDIDYLKIDQSFVRGLSELSSDHAICEAMIVMAHKLGIKVVAEGVETTQQHDLLSIMGCDFGQGYLYSKAVNVQTFERMLTKATQLDS